MGGIGSASIVLALRSTVENAIGGLLLKLQDKFRIGEVISLAGGKESPCLVEELNYINTRLRRPDNSLLVVPNHAFTQGEIVNWSRTPYRLFKTSIAVAVPNLQGLHTLVQKIRGKLLEVSDIESSHRDIIVAATGFKDNKVIVEIDIHLKSTNEIRCAEIKTEVINLVNTCLNVP